MTPMLTGRATSKPRTCLIAVSFIAVTEVDPWSAATCRRFGRQQLDAASLEKAQDVVATTRDGPKR
jgi:hypothetical protein